jgi:hypothetical protein
MRKVSIGLLLVAGSACGNQSDTCSQASYQQVAAENIQLPDGGGAPSCVVAWSCGGSASETVALACAPVGGNDVLCYCCTGGVATSLSGEVASFNCDPTQALAFYNQICEAGIQTQ